MTQRRMRRRGELERWHAATLHPAEAGHVGDARAARRLPSLGGARADLEPMRPFALSSHAKRHDNCRHYNLLQKKLRIHRGMCIACAFHFEANASSEMSVTKPAHGIRLENKP